MHQRQACRLQVNLSTLIAGSRTLLASWWRRSVLSYYRRLRIPQRTRQLKAYRSAELELVIESQEEILLKDRAQMRKHFHINWSLNLRSVLCPLISTQLQLSSLRAVRHSLEARSCALIDLSNKQMSQKASKGKTLGVPKVKRINWAWRVCTVHQRRSPALFREWSPRKIYRVSQATRVVSLTWKSTLLKKSSLYLKT